MPNPREFPSHAKDTIATFERAAEQRFFTAEFLRTKRRLEALYFYGYVAEMCLKAACFRSEGFGKLDPIPLDTIKRRLAEIDRSIKSRRESIIWSGSHPLVGWAKLLEWRRSGSGNLTPQQANRLKEAVNKSIEIYRFWRADLRYKTRDFSVAEVEIVRQAAKWLLENKSTL